MHQRFKDYEIVAQLHASARTLVVSARRRDDSSAVLLKVPHPAQRGSVVEANYAREARLRNDLGQDGVHLDRHMGLPMLVSPDTGAVTLRNLIEAPEPVSVATWLRIAHGASRQLEALHARGILHRDIHPGNLLWSSSTGEVAMIDFDHSVALVEAAAHPLDPQALGDSLPYRSPESAGRMSVGEDERSDLYSLGITLYEVLVGERPFKASDPLELVHQHMTQAPVAAHLLREDVSLMASAIVAKLLEKSPGQRYQSSRGLAFDLGQVSERHGESGWTAGFELGSHDVPDRYRPSSELFGRDIERSDLLRALDDARHGRGLLYMIAGYSGIGKTALAHQVREPTLLAGGIYAEGKCDQYQRLQPYSALARALESIVAQILRRPKSQRLAIRKRLVDAVGANGGLLTGIVPSLETLIGTQAAVSELGVQEGRNRLAYVFVDFLACLAAELPPLVIFLDDLQWMDTASLNLLQAIAQARKIRQVLLVGTYRDNEVDDAHPVTHTLKAIRKEAPDALRATTLGALSVTDLADMFAANLNMARDAAQELATVIHAKAGGNPFASHQFLKRMADLRILHFDEARSGWSWDADRLAELPLAEHVVDLLLERLRELPESTQQLLQLGACIGSRFESDVLATVAECSPRHVEHVLHVALTEGLVRRGAQTFSFVHDRVQQTAYRLTAESDRPGLHLAIGRRLLNARSDADDGQWLFDIVAHFEQGRSLLVDVEERRQVCELAVIAARNARAASAHDVALRNFRLALELAGDMAWQHDPEQHWRLYLETIQSEFTNAQHERVASMIEVAERHAGTTLDRVTLYELECQFAIAQNDQNAAIDLALKALELLGIRFADDAKGLASQAEQLRGEVHLPAEEVGTLINLEDMSDPEPAAAMRIMVSASGAAYVMRPALWEVLTLQIMRITLKYGNSPLAAFGYGFYGVLLAGVYRNIEQGYAFGQLSTQLLEHYSAEPLRAKIVNLFDVFVRHWKEHLRNSLEELPQGLQSGIDYGDFEYGSYNAIQHGKHQVICGCPLDEVLDQQNAYIRVIERLKMGYHLDFARIWRQLAVNLSGRAEDPHRLVSDNYDAEALIPQLIEQSSNFLVFNIYCTQTMLAYLLGRHEDALRAADAATPFSNFVSGMAEIAEHNFFHSLSLLATLEPGDALGNRRRLRQVVRNQRQLEDWARHAPMNFRHKWLLVEAERVRRSSSPQRSAQLYEQAIEGARETYYLNDQALATELYGESMLDQGRRLLGGSLIREAADLYHRWQAHEKTKQLRRRYAYALQSLTAGDEFSGSAHDLAKVNFDVQSALRASLAIANETEAETLERRLLQILAKSAGAQHGLLLIQNGHDWVLSAEFDADGARSINSLVHNDLDLPHAVFAHVIRQRRSLVLDDAADSGHIVTEPYVIAHGVRSVLCVPLLHSNVLIGLVFLEHRQTTGAFPAASTRIVEILAAQSIVAIEKARLLATLEQQVESRTRQLTLAKGELENVNASLQSSEERFRLAMRATSEGLFDWDVSTGTAFFSAGWKRMLGYAEDELDESIDTWWALVDPAEVEAVDDSAKAQLSGTEDNFELECRLRHKDGHYIEVVTRASIVRGEDDAALRVVGSSVDVTAEREQQAAIIHQALHDPLTDLANRVRFTECLELARQVLRRGSAPFALHLIDLDRFKECNDTLGHLAGDEVLRQTAARMQALMRDTDTVARLGGDEFAIIQMGVITSENVDVVTRKLIVGVEEPIQLEDGTLVSVGCSIGVRVVDDAGLSAETLLRQADIALYQSKHEGRGQATVYSASLSN